MYITHPRLSSCRYLPHYHSIQKEFRGLVKRVHNKQGRFIVSDPQFLETWRIQYREKLSVISPIIYYYTRHTTEYTEILTRLYTNYVGNTSPKSYQLLAIMHRYQDAFYADVIQERRDGGKLVRTLKQAKYL